MGIKLFLVGYMGCGKTSLGKKLSKVTGYELVDMDSVIEQREGAAISEIFHFAGEEYFRRAERALIEELATSDGDMIISTGGGAPTWGDNMDYMNRAGVCVYLRRSAEQIASRLSPHGRQKRPKLRGLNDEELVAFMTENMAEREPFYSQAKCIIECAERSDAEIIEIVLSYLKNYE